MIKSSYMQIKYIDENWLKDEVRNAVRKHLSSPHYKIFFFGSRVKGDNFERSDIDIGIEGPEPLDAETKLEIKEELENIPTLYSFDFVDFTNAGKTFKDHAMKHVEYIN